MLFQAVNLILYHSQSIIFSITTLFLFSICPYVYVIVYYYYCFYIMYNEPCEQKIVHVLEIDVDISKDEDLQVKDVVNDAE